MSPLTALFERPSSERPSSERPSFGTPSAHSQRWLARVTAPLFFIASHAMAESNAGVKCDFNGDFAPDLAFSVPGETVAGLVLSGGINVQMLAPNLATVLAQHLQDGDELHPTPVAGTRVAGALACGDFDADGYGDLAIGIPERDEGEGMVTVIFGGPAGLDANLTHHLWQLEFTFEVQRSQIGWPEVGGRAKCMAFPRSGVELVSDLITLTLSQVCHGDALGKVLP